MTTQTKRRSIFERFMPKSDAADAEGILRSLDEQLANAGVEKKEVTHNTWVYKAMLKELAKPKHKGVLEEMGTDVDDLLKKISDVDPTQLRNKIIATIMGHMAKVGVEDEEEEVVVEEEPTGDEMPIPVEEEEEGEELMNFAKTLIKENNEMHKDVKELAKLVPAFIGMASAMKELVPLVESSSKVDALVADMAEMQKKMKARPRVASKDNGNIFKDATVEQELKEGTDGESTFFGHKVKKS